MYTIITIILCLTALFAFINAKFLKLPNTIGMMMMATVFSISLQYGMNHFPWLFGSTQEVLSQLDFSRIVFEVLLSFLLFAGAMHTDYNLLKEHKTGILLFSLFGVLISTFLIALVVFYSARFLNISIPFIYCVLFGAVVSPTDPIAVLGILTKAGVPKKIEINIVGESLFNDGVAVVLFAVVLHATQAGIESIGPLQIVQMFLQEAIGGVLFGVLLGYVLYYGMKQIDDYETEILLTLAAVMGGTILASSLHVSAPLAMVACGLMTGSKTKDEVMSDNTRLYVDKFWHLIDVLLNAILFVLMGLKLISIPFQGNAYILSLICIPAALIIRYISLWIPFQPAQKFIDLKSGDLMIMTWGGLRGGLSIAMALSLPEYIQHKSLFVSTTYAMVVFSIFIQGLSIQKMASTYFQSKKKDNL